MTLQVERIVSGKLQQNGYVVFGPGRQALIVDPGGNAAAFGAFIDENELVPGAILNTHGHFDHIGAVAPLMDRYRIPFYLDGADARILRGANIYKFLFESTESVVIPEITHNLIGQLQPVTIADFTVTCIATPGHTPGGRCFLIGGVMFTGDTLFCGNIGRTDLYGGDARALAKSVTALMELPPETTIYPGHGRPSTIGDERGGNPYVLDLMAMEKAG